MFFFRNSCFGVLPLAPRLPATVEDEVDVVDRFDSEGEGVALAVFGVGELL